MNGKEIQELVNREYQYGFKTDIEQAKLVQGLSEDTIRQISRHKGEPEFMLEFRLGAFRKWQKMSEPRWAHLSYPPIDYQNLIYYAEPKQTKPLDSMDDVDPKLKRTFEKLGIPLLEQKRLAGVAVDAIFDSISVATTFKKKLLEAGIIFCPISEALQHYPDLIKQYMGSVVPPTDNFFAALNSAVFTDGSFVYIPKNTKCPMELSSYFRINTEGSGQFERTLIICEDHSQVNYLEGCTAPKFDTNQLHAAIVELIAFEHAEIKYSTVQNWYAGDPVTGKGGIYNFVTKRGKCAGKHSKISWTQIETGSAITWKYPSCVLAGDNSIGEFYSVAVTTGYQQADTGTKMIHLGKNTKSTIISKGISAGHAKNNYRGLVLIGRGAENARNFTQCDSLLVGSHANANTFPYHDIQHPGAQVEHEASTSKISDDQLFYFKQRGIGTEAAMSTILNGFCKDVFRQLPAEFAVEANQLLDLKLEGSVA